MEGISGDKIDVGNDDSILRDEFAGKAMQGLMSAHDSNGLWTVADCEKKIAEMAYAMADAMIKERARRVGEE